MAKTILPGRKTQRGELSDRSAAKLLRTVRKAPAAMTLEEMKDLESAISADRGVVRRMALAVLTQPGQKLLDAVKDRAYAVALADLSERLTGYTRGLRNVLELLESAEMWLIVALATREDMDDLIKQCEIEKHGQEGHA